MTTTTTTHQRRNDAHQSTRRAGRLYQARCATCDWTGEGFGKDSDGQWAGHLADLAAAEDLVPAPDHLWGVDDERKDRNAARAAEKGLEPCTHCGRGVAEGKGFQIVVVNGGEHIARPGSAAAEDMDDAGYMGAWVLGSTCAKGIPAAFRTTWNGWS